MQRATVLIVLALCVCAFAQNNLIQFNANSASGFSYFPLSGNKFTFDVQATNDIKVVLYKTLGSVPYIEFTLHTGTYNMALVDNVIVGVSPSTMMARDAQPRPLVVSWNETWVGMHEGDGRLLIDFKPPEGMWSISYVGLASTAPKSTFTFNVEQLIA